MSGTGETFTEQSTITSTEIVPKKFQKKALVVQE